MAEKSDRSSQLCEVGYAFNAGTLPAKPDNVSTRHSVGVAFNAGALPVKADGGTAAAVHPADRNGGTGEEILSQQQAERAHLLPGDWRSGQRNVGGGKYCHKVVHALASPRGIQYRPTAKYPA